MPSTKTVRALVSAFNVHNYARNIVKTNFKLQSRGKKGYIVVSFDKSMDTYQCIRYLNSIKRKIIREFYGIEESNDAEILDTAKLIFDVNSFPFNISDRDWSWDEQNGCKLVIPVDKGVIFNLKSHLASSLEKDVLEDMQISSTTVPFNKGKYLCCSKFDNKELCKEFESKFLLRMKERYGNVPKNPLKVEGNSVYIRDVFDDARFIDSVTRYKAWLVGMYLGVDSSANHKVKLFKDMIVESIGQLTGVTIYGFICASPLDREEASVLISLVLDSGRRRVLTNEEALKLNYAFNYAVFNDLYGRIQGELSIDRRNGIYGMDFSDKEISHCVITKIIESSVINKDHELSIDPELHFRALSPAQSPFNSPTHAGPSGLKTPPRQRQKDSGSSRGVPGPLTELSDIEWESLTRSQDGALEGSPRQGSEKLLLHNPVNLAGTSGELPPRSHLSYTTVSYDVSGPSSSLQSVGAAQNVPAGTSARAQQPNRWSLPAPIAGLWSLQQSRPSSWEGANPVGANLWAQQTNPCLSQGSNVITPSIGRGIPMKSILLTTKNDPKSSSPEFSARSPGVEDVKNIFSVEPEKQQVTDKSVQGACGGSPKKPNFWREEWSRLSGKKSKESSPDGDSSIPGTNFPTNSGTAQQFVDAGKSEISVKPEYRKTPSRDSSLGLSPKLRGSAMHGSVQASTSPRAQKRCSSLAPSGDVPRSRPQPQVSSFVSEPSSSKGANEGMLAEMNALFPWLGTQSPQSPQLIESVPSCLFRQEPSQVFMVNESLSSGWKISNELPPSNKLNDKEKELFEKLLYTLNLTNYTFGGVYTNFFAKDGKIVSLLHDNVDREKYFQAVRDYIIKKYFGDKKEAGKACDLNEFPFKLSDSYYEDRQGKTVVANISGGAVSNLKILFSQKFKKDVDAIDISVVKEVEKHEKDEWVERQVSEGCSLQEICISCFPHEGAMKQIPIAFEGGEYVLDRIRDTCEVRSLWKEKSRLAKGTSKAGKTKPEDNKDSGYSSGCVTDAEKVSSNDGSMDYQASSHVQQQNPWSDDESNSRESSRSGSSNSSSKRALELSVENLRISTKLDATKTEQQLSLTKKLRSN